MKAVIVCGKLTPLHAARMCAAATEGKSLGHGLAALEVASTQHDYQWPEGKEHRPFDAVTLFQGQEYWSLPYKSVRRGMRRELDRLRPDVVVLPGWGFKEARAGLGWCLKNGVPRVIISDSQSIDVPQHPIKLLLKRVLVKRFQAGFVGGAPHARYLERLGIPAERCFPGCDVVDNGMFTPTEGPEREGGVDARPLLFSTLRLLPRKNILATLRVLATSGSQWGWTIAGDGPQRQEIERTIAELGLRDRVRLLGHVDYYQLPRHYGKADVYIQPSLSEPWGLAVNEAMASGLPVLVSNRCGCREDLVQEGTNGYLFDPADPASIGHALDRLLHERQRWADMGRASREIIRQWGLDFYARNLWRACHQAVTNQGRGIRNRALNTVLGLAL